MIVHMIGNAHIDPVWLWRWHEGLDRPLWGNSPPRSLWLASEQRAVADGKMPHLE